MADTVRGNGGGFVWFVTIRVSDNCFCLLCPSTTPPQEPHLRDKHRAAAAECYKQFVCLTSVCYCCSRLCLTEPIAGVDARYMQQVMDLDTHEMPPSQRHLINRESEQLRRWLDQYEAEQTRRKSTETPTQRKHNE